MLTSCQMEAVPPSFMEDDVNQFDFQEYDDNFKMSPPEEVPVNQSSISCNDQAGQNLLVDDNDSIQQTTHFHLHFLKPWPNPYDPQSSTMLPEPSQTLRSPQFPPHNLQVSGDHDVFNSNCYDSMLFEPTSSSRIQYIPNQGQVDQPSVIPHIDNMEQENLVP
ncbi:hypothetical protein SADUNF_Sadunf19G0027800 [Salix dunnii]|uniref:Uncharacterized protein n=1 Tax=Salix dunnii TaxID=1413687 RepID=A0A835IY39_9ROSI|nr:hypothetical protein SADUNF_Sadunf19G0027800 [Salix dunnii]